MSRIHLLGEEDVVIAVIGGSIFLGLVCVGLYALVTRMKGTRWVTVGEQVPMVVPVQAIPAGLAGLGMGSVITPGPGRAALVLRRAPVWVVVPVLLLFPLGLLFLLYREDVAIEVTPSPDGGSAWLSGRTEAKTLAAVRGVLAGA